MENTLGELNQRIYYGFSSDRRASVRDVVNSLYAAEAMFGHAVELAGLLDPALRDIKIQVYPETISAGSLDDNLLVRFFFGGKEQLHEAVDGLRENKLLKRLLADKQILAALYLLILLTPSVGGAVYLTGKTFKWLQSTMKLSESDMSEAVRLHKQILDVLEKDTGLDKKDIAEKTVQLLDNNPKIISDTQRTLSIVQGDSQGVIELNGNNVTSVPQSVLSQMATPADIQVSTMSTRYNDVLIELRATDLDSGSRWAGRIDKISPDRVKLRLYKDINPAKLAGVRKLKGNVIAEFQTNEIGETKPVKYTLFTVLVTDRDSSLFEEIE